MSSRLLYNLTPRPHQAPLGLTRRPLSAVGQRSIGARIGASECRNLQCCLDRMGLGQHWAGLPFSARTQWESWSRCRHASRQDPIDQLQVPDEMARGQVFVENSFHRRRPERIGKLAVPEEAGHRPNQPNVIHGFDQEP